MINKQSMVDHIRKVQAKAHQLQQQAELLEDESKKLVRESVRLQEVLARSVREGNGTLGDPLLDLALVASDRIDSNFAEAFTILRDEWNAHQGEYFVFWDEQWPHRTYKPKSVKICLGMIEGEMEFTNDDIRLTSQKNLPSVDFYPQMNSVSYRLGNIDAITLNVGHDLYACGVMDERNDLKYVALESKYTDGQGFRSHIQALSIGNTTVAGKIPWYISADKYHDVFIRLRGLFQSNLAKG